MNLDRHQFSTIGGFLQEGQGGGWVGHYFKSIINHSFIRFEPHSHLHGNGPNSVVPQQP